jgi:hypothetical protein
VVEPAVVLVVDPPRFARIVSRLYVSMHFFQLAFFDSLAWFLDLVPSLRLHYCNFRFFGSVFGFGPLFNISPRRMERNEGWSHAGLVLHGMDCLCYGFASRFYSHAGFVLHGMDCLCYGFAVTALRVCFTFCFPTPESCIGGEGTANTIW